MVFPDTDVFVDLIRDHLPAVDWFGSLGDEPVVVSGFVAMELVQGSRDGPAQRRVERALFGCHIEWPSREDCERALDLFARFHLSHRLGLLDALIAAQALGLEVVLLTFNERHYSAVSGLRTARPYDR